MGPRSPEPHEPADPLDQPVSRRSAALVSTGFAYASLAFVIMRNLGLVPLFVSAIGTEEYGAWLATGAVLLQLTNIDFGLLGVLGQRVARAYGAGERLGLESLIGSGLLVIAAIALAVGLIAAVFAPLAAKALGIEGEQGQRLTRCMLIACGANVLQVAAFGLAEVLRNLQRPVLPGTNAILGEATSLALTVWLVYAGFGLYAIPLGLALRGAWMLLGNSLGFVYVVVRQLEIHPTWNRNAIRSLLRDSSYLFATQVAFRIRSYMDPLLVGIILGPTAAGIFAITLKTHEMVKLLAVQVGSAIMPGLSHLFGQQAERRLHEMVVARYKISALVGAIGLGGCIAFNESFVRLWVGDALYTGNPVNVLFAIASLIFMITACAYDALFARGEFRAIVRVVWLDALGRLPFLLLGIAFWGLLGAAIATLLTTIVFFAVPITASLVSRQPTPPGEARLLARNLTAVAVGLTGLALATLAWSPVMDSWLELALAGSAFVAVASLLASALDPAFVRFLWRRGAGSPLARPGGL